MGLLVILHMFFFWEFHPSQKSLWEEHAMCNTYFMVHHTLCGETPGHYREAQVKLGGS